MLSPNTRANKDRAEHDFYATPPRAVEGLLAAEQFTDTVWEPCCGGGHISEVLCRHGYNVHSTDLINHGYGQAGIDFLSQTEPATIDIITNPPYIQAQTFVEHALSLIAPERKVAMFLRLVFLESSGRRALFEKHPPARVYVASARLGCAKNGEFKRRADGELFYPSAVAYAWFVWEKGFVGSPTLHWFN